MFSELFTLVPIYSTIALIATILFVIKIIFSLLVGEAEFDTPEIEDISSDGSFVFLSIQSILAFAMGLGWMGVACKLQFGLSGTLTLLISFGFGCLLLILNSWLSLSLRKLHHESSVDINQCKGGIGKVYLSIPSNQSGEGQIETSLNGKSVILQALTKGDKIPSFASVVIDEIVGKNTVLVSKK